MPIGGLRLIAQRAIVIDWKVVLFNDQGLRGWWTRIKDCYGELPSDISIPKKMKMIYDNYEIITDDRLLSIAKKYKASYAILYKKTPSIFPVLFSDVNYKLIKIQL